MANQRVRTSDALRTYRYLRIGMIGAVVLLAASVSAEGVDQGCWQPSISAYFYTPAKAIFVGVLIAMGFAMVVIKGRTTFEDTALNFAGMLAPIVALAPTSPPNGTELERCRTFVPPADELAAAVDNNIWALLVTGVVCLGAGFVITIILKRNITAPVTEVDEGTWKTLLAAFVAVGLAILLKVRWDDDFASAAHSKAAGAMFVCMFLAAVSAARAARRSGGDAGRSPAERASQRRYAGLYALTALGMLVGVVTAVLDLGRQEVLVLEAWEIFWFGFFWAVQTAERWNEPPVGSTALVAATAE